MGTTAEKLTYLNTTKTKIRTGLNDLGAELTENDTFRSYANALADIYDEYPKVTGEGTDLELTPTKKGKLAITPKGNSSQFSTTGKNLFNGIYTENKGINSSGANYNKDGSNTSTYQNVSANTTYTISGTTVIRVAEYDVNKSYLRRKDNVQTFTTGESTEFIRFEGQMNDWNNTQLELGSSATSYEPYTGGIPAPNPDYPYPVKTVTGENNLIISNENLFDKNNVTSNYYLNSDGDLVESTTWEISNYINVIPNETYTYTGLTSVGTAPMSCYYDENKQFISSFKQNTGTNNITIPSNAKFVIFTIRQYQPADFNTFMFVKGSTAPSEYVAHEEQNYQLSLGDIELNSSPDGTISDEIRGTLDNWFKREYIGKVVLNGSENWDYTNGVFNLSTTTRYLLTNWLCNALTFGGTATNTSTAYQNGNNKISVNTSGSRFYIRIDDITSVSNFKTYLSSNNIIVNAPLSQYTDIPITDTTLISQLNDIYENAKSYNGTTNITSTYEDGNEQMVLDAGALKSWGVV